MGADAERAGEGRVGRRTLHGGPPEYGGNRDLVGWEYTQWPGDSQPRGYTDEEVSNP